MFLYGGGIVNYFFYVWLNGALLTAGVLGFAWRRNQISRSVAIRRGLFILIVAPVWSLVIYAVQLTATAYVSGDISHAATGYEQLAVFGNRFIDVVGLVVPKFGLLAFGSTLNPRLMPGFSNANLFYAGMLPLFLVVVAAVAMRGRVVAWLLSGILLNLLLSFGGMLSLYDLTLLFPGNDQFRGHYKYLTLVGIYLALLCALALERLRAGRYAPVPLRRAAWASGFVVLALALVGGAAAFASVARNASAESLVTTDVDVLTSIGNGSFRSALFLLLAVAGTLQLVRRRDGVAMLAVALLVFLDLSVNYKYAPYYSTRLDDLSSKTMFDCCEGKTVAMRLDGFSQAYIVPELVDVDPVGVYTAIPNKYLVSYAGRLFTPTGAPAISLLRGVTDGVLTTSRVDDPQLQLRSSKVVTASNASRYYRYDPDAPIHDTWGPATGLVGAEVYYYELQGAVRNFVATSYQVVPESDDVLPALERMQDQRTPIVVGRGRSGGAPGEPRAARVLREDETGRAFEVTSGPGAIFVSDIPYSRVWRAKVDGRSVATTRVNHTFVGVKLNESSQVVTLDVDRGPLRLGLWASLLGVFALVVGLALTYRSRTRG